MLFAESPSFSPGRRQFVTSAFATAALTGCSSFDRWVIGDNARLNEEVMVLGGGLAGLAAAYHLKKNKIHYRLYEASSRLGGRVQSVKHFNADQQVAELGAEFFEGSHKSLLALCKDFNLTAEDATYDPKSDRAVYWIQGKVMGEKEFRRLLKPIATKLALTRQETFAALPTDINPKALSGYARAAGVDQKSLADLLAALKTQANKEVVDAFEGLCVSEWGVESNEINLLQFLARLDFEERSMAGGAHRIYRVKGGASQLIDILGERVQGIVANASLKLEHQLVAIRSKSNGFECTFKTPGGSDVIWARQIICTLPWSILKEVAGIQNLDIHANAKALIAQAKYATHAKVTSSFKDPLWKKRGGGFRSQGQFRGELAGQNYWDSSRGQAGARGLLTSQRGGARGLATGANAAAESLKDLRLFFRDQAAEESSLVTNWSTKPYSKGSRFNVGPGQYLKYLEFLGEEPTSSSTFYFAGEHMSFKDFGTMNGAYETAIEAADRAMQKAYLKSFI